MEKEQSIYYYYLISCRDELVKHSYIGKTQNFELRKQHHKYHCNDSKYPQHNYKLYKTIRKYGGFLNFKIELIYEVHGLSRQEACEFERALYDEYRPSLNNNIPNRSYKEYIRDNYKQILIKRKDRENCFWCQKSVLKSHMKNHRKSKKCLLKKTKKLKNEILDKLQIK